MDWLPGRRPRGAAEEAEAPRDVGAEVDQLRWQVDDLRSEVAALRAQVSRLLDHIDRLSARQQPTVIRPTAISSGTRASTSRTASAAPAAAVATQEPVEAILEAYRAAAADLASAGETFMAERHPRGLARVSDGGGWRLEEDARGAFLWGVPYGRGWLLLPGYRALKDWRSHFAYQREQNAADYFGDAFDLDPAPGRFDVTPAVGQLDGEVLRLRKRGVIRGFRG